METSYIDLGVNRGTPKCQSGTPPATPTTGHCPVKAFDIVQAVQTKGIQYDLCRARCLLFSNTLLLSTWRETSRVAPCGFFCLTYPPRLETPLSQCHSLLTKRQLYGQHRVDTDPHPPACPVCVTSRINPTLLCRGKKPKLINHWPALSPRTVSVVQCR